MTFAPRPTSSLGIRAIALPSPCCCWISAGRLRRAPFCESLAHDEFCCLYRDNEWLLGMAMASEACALLGAADHAAVLYAQLLPFSGSHAIGHAEGSVGATDRYLGLLAATLGDLDAAIAHLEAGMQLNDQMGSPPWTAHTQVDLARDAARARRTR